jgi:alcohol dehydrogenase (cytochrome c)
MASFLPPTRPAMRPFNRPSARPRSRPDARTPGPRHSVAPLLLFLGLLGAAGCDAGPDEPGSPAAAETTALPDPTFPSVTDTLIGRGPANDWPTHGGGPDNHRFSRLDQVTTANVAELVPVWVYSTGLEGAFEATPLVLGNALYVTTARGRVVALNAATGAELWTYDPEPRLAALCCGPTNRGVAAYGNRIYVASLDARLIALDARTGRVAWEAQLGDAGAGYSATMAPLAVGGERYGIRGFLAAFDAASGEELWRWHTIPDVEEGGWWGQWRSTDPFGTELSRDVPEERSDSIITPGSWRVGGGGIATTPAYDPTTDRVFVNVEGPAPLVDGGVRPGDNLYTGSIVALDGATGELAWHTQYLPHDVWGLAGGSPPFLFDRGSERYVGFAGRTGWVYVFSAENGRPILRSDNFVPQEGLFTPPTREEGVRLAPGANGGNAGAGVAYDPGTGVVYVGGVHQPMVYARRPEPYGLGRLWLGGSVRFDPDSPHWGTVTAIDLADGEIRWQRQTPAPVHSDALATAGGLLFVGQGSGTLDAFNADTGQLLWQFNTGAGVHGGPVTYAVAGTQYVVAPAGGSYHFDTPPGDDLIAFALASRRPSRTVSSYPEPRYERGGAREPGQTAVRQVPRDSVRDPGQDGARPR